MRLERRLWVAVFVAFGGIGVGAQETHTVPFFPAVPAATETGGAQGFLQVYNHSAEAGQVRIVGFDDGGRRAGPASLELAAGDMAHIDAADFQNGNPGKGLATGVGAPRNGDWWLALTSDLDIEVRAYARGADGFLTTMHDVAPASGGLQRIAFFNPGGNTRQQSRLRLVNPGNAPVDATIHGVDDHGRHAGPVRATVPARAAHTFTAQDLETGAESLVGALGDGAGKWRLTIAASGRLHALSLLANPTGHIANLSTVPERDAIVHQVPLFPAASGSTQGFLRVVNRGSAGAVRIVAFDETGTVRPPITLAIGTGRTTHFNSKDLENGNEAKGLSAGVGTGVGDWRLELRAEPASEGAAGGAPEIQVLAYIRSPDGFIASMHDLAPVAGVTHRVPVFDLGDNTAPESLLRVINLGAAPAAVIVSDLADDGGAGGERHVVLGVPAEGVYATSTATLAQGEDGSVRSLGQGVGAVAMTANQPIATMSLLRRPGGALSNLSTTPPRTATQEPTPDPPPMQPLPLLDAIPHAGGEIDPATGHIDLVHTAPEQDAYAYADACATGVAVRRTLPQGEDDPVREVVNHKLECELEPLSSHRARVDGVDGDNTGIGTALAFTTGGEAEGPALSVRHARMIPRDAVNDMLDGYIEDALIADIKSSWVQLLVAALVDELARRTWAELRNPDARYDVVAQSVSYASRSPTGSPSEAVTGLVAMPDTGAVPDFARKNRVVVLSHATGATPSALDDGDAWFALAAMFAGRGYLTIAPDNWGRGELTPPGEPETYLMGNRSANNSVDLLKAVLADDAYQPFHDAEAERADVSIIGYSQGGHTALALWLALHTGEHGVAVRELFAGAGPHNLLRTFRGAMQRFGGECDGNEWCRHVDDDVVLPYVVGRILPALLAYTETGLASSDVLEDGDLRADFVTGFLAGDAQYERLEAILALNSFTNLIAPASAIRHGTQINLYHSEYDRLVPQANTRELAALLAKDFDVVHHDDECNNNAYETVFELVDRPGVLHLICGMEVLDDVLKRFP